ncbi:uncharacterized protein PFL1_04434 [Pseudozyma flocculosa PF-1]|uniref:Uncharacterized protein n=2 Tax=Pseudozyma flocculosa TaxID=84751 RepID=A0A5C3FDZ2_9BASI|nr:uncharacterized protein PFL1_04434 [Pseudozyma flocculosa PF-1]EPQ28107.1 hypothetical protein PFL1_04434 [Pseudozyma flocculosa PF-1]SPO41905.1 uncharacterized protein PSFLO_07387 [Pseudozyma flocculosa]
MTTSGLMGILPRSPSPSASSPNPGPRSDVTHFIRSTDTTPKKGAAIDASSSSSRHAAAIAPLTIGTGSGGSTAPEYLAQHDAGAALSPRLSTASIRRYSFGGTVPTSTGNVGRRSIAHSYRVLGFDEEAEEAVAMSRLKNGQVDVSWPEIHQDDNLTPSSPSASRSAHSRSGSLLSKGKARADSIPDRIAEDPYGEFSDADDTLPLADIDLEQGAGPSASGAPSHSTQGAADRSIYGHKSPSRLGLLRGLGIGQSDAASPYAPRAKEYESDEEDLEASKPTYFREFGSTSGGESGGGLGKMGSPDGFEAVTARESAWMWASVLLVAAICLVAMLISTDVIDWPGDGLGRN